MKMPWKRFTEPKHTAQGVANELAQQFQVQAAEHQAWDEVINKALAEKGFGILAFTTLKPDFDEYHVLAKRDARLNGMHMGILVSRDPAVKDFKRVGEAINELNLFPAAFGENPLVTGGPQSNEAGLVLVENVKEKLGVKMEADTAGRLAREKELAAISQKS